MQPEQPELTSLSFSETKIMLERGEFIYRQSIEIKSPKSANLLYAYKLSTLKAEPLPGFATDNEGWLQGEAGIWTSSNLFSLDFASQNGKIQDIINGVLVKIKHPDGRIEELKSPFRSTRVIGTLIEVPFYNGDNVGAGIEFRLRELVGDIYVDGMYAHHFMYRLNLLDESLQVIQTGDWHSSINSPDIRKIVLTQHTIPALNFNPPDTYTQFECYVVSRTGVEQAEPTKVYFKVVDGNQPVAIIYPQTLAGLGQYHYGIVEGDGVFYANPIPPQGTHRNRRLWQNGEVMEAINSPDFKLHLRWGYKGQYGYLSPSGALIYSDDPFDRELNSVLNPAGTNYFSQITAFWLRLDGAAFPAQPQFFNAQVVTDLDGLSWLRVPNLNENSRHCILPGLGNSQHTLELRVEDLQGVLSQPTQKVINLVPYKSPEQRSGILVIDDSPAHTNNSPEALVDAFYEAVTPTAWGGTSTIDLATQGTNRVSPVTMQDYKAILWHSDNPSNSPNIMLNVDALDIYLGHQGNLVWSGTQRISDALTGSFSSSYTSAFLSSRLGIFSSDDHGFISNSLATNPFFVNAIGQPGYNDIPLNLTDPFNSIVNLRQGLSAVTFFSSGVGTAQLYGFGCKPVDAPTFPPTMAQYDFYQHRNVAYKHTNAGSTVVVFGFPLSYMEQAPVATALQTVFNDILGGLTAQRRSK